MAQGCIKKNVGTRNHNLVTHLPGPTGETKNVRSELECWYRFFTSELREIMIISTNIYIEKQKDNYIDDPSKAKATDICEIKCVLGLLHLTAIFKSNCQNFEDRWQTDGTGVEIFRATMSLQRFRFLLRCLRFDDLNTREKRIILDKFALFRFFSKHLFKTAKIHHGSL
nr:unnamed protein product [Callosobruchus chinensis]